MTETDLSAWLVTMEAAMRIGCSTRTIERLASAGKLEQRIRPQAGTPGVAVYSPESVAEEAARRRQAPPPFVVGAGQDRPTNGNGHHALLEQKKFQSGTDLVPAGDDLFHQFCAAVVRVLQSPPSPPMAERLSERPVLTVDEAVAASGWSRTYLLRKIHNGTLKAEKDRGWKIRRKDLEAL